MTPIPENLFMTPEGHWRLLEMQQLAKTPAPLLGTEDKEKLDWYVEQMLPAVRYVEHVMYQKRPLLKNHPQELARWEASWQERQDGTDSILTTLEKLAVVKWNSNLHRSRTMKKHSEEPVVPTDLDFYRSFLDGLVNKAGPLIQEGVRLGRLRGGVAQQCAEDIQQEHEAQIAWVKQKVVDLEREWEAELKLTQEQKT